MLNHKEKTHFALMFPKVWGKKEEAVTSIEVLRFKHNLHLLCWWLGSLYRIFVLNGVSLKNPRMVLKTKKKRNPVTSLTSFKGDAEKNCGACSSENAKSTRHIPSFVDGSREE